MGVPVVTLAGDRVSARQTLGFLREAGLDDLIAESKDDYVRIAAALAADAKRRADLRRTLRPRLAASPLTDAKAFTPGLEQAYRQMWRRWCEGQPPRAMDIA
jgi:predicted O-linked N-acetylglucosamine transferase (SPINDLY family)